MSYTQQSLTYNQYTVQIGNIGGLTGSLQISYPTAVAQNTTVSVQAGNNSVRVIAGLAFTLSLANLPIPNTKTQYKATGSIDQTVS